MRQANTISAGGQDITQSDSFSGNTKTGGILYPRVIVTSIHPHMGDQEFTITLNDVKLNEGVSAEDFK
ncbi:hypothetical protein [Niabella hirudinis]|uniref:hypothetical protein n=1 Tax=Niabella hirudinis TaxID=1285929 RepID=UPI003EB8ABAB